MIKVFYDGKCGLCSKEINHYKSIAPKDVFEWVDVTESSLDLSKETFSLAEALKVLHVKNSKNELFLGLDAFILIWSKLPKFRILATITSLPVIRSILRFAYKKFANWRFKKIKYCNMN
ncbi:DUF393 domain-containing protein [Candidatus Thioglobus sp.]|nr:DUF393 domain-containing protein [Candidatus Thioglobus sp.]